MFQDVKEAKSFLNVYMNVSARLTASVNPFVSIGRYLTPKGKVKVRVICLNISFLT